MDREIPFSFPACAESADDRTKPGNLSNSTNAPSSEDRQYQSNCESAMVSYIALVIIRHVASEMRAVVIPPLFGNRKILFNNIEK